MILPGGVVNPSVSFADSSLYTREPLALLRLCDKLEFGEQLPKEYVGAVCDRLRAHTVRPYDVACKTAR